MNKSELKDLIERAKPHIGKFKPVRVGLGKKAVNVTCQFVRIGNASSISEDGKENFSVNAVLIAQMAEKFLNLLKL